MRFLLAATFIHLTACGSLTVSASDAATNPTDTATVDTASVPVDTSSVPIDAHRVSIDTPSTTDAPVSIADVRLNPVDVTPGANDTALGYCRATCASVVRCNPSRVAASCELSCALVTPLFSDAALAAARGTCFGPMATCASARSCFLNALGLRNG